MNYEIFEAYSRIPVRMDRLETDDDARRLAV